MSSPYIVSARKYRPSTFSSVVGQMSLTRTLKNAISTGRLAQAYLFCGPRGVGKTSCARIFAKTINCGHRTADGEACGKCESCRDFERGVSYNVIELDAASNNGVDNMRSLTEQVNVPPASGRYRVFIIDEVHMLSTGAFNAFLKTLEEPPAYAVFILATTEKNKVLPTILSRCQTYDFARITEHDIAHQLRRIADAESISAEDAALEVIARKADGAMRDALSIFDQVAAASGGNITYRTAIDSLNVLDYEVYFQFTDAFAAADVAQALLLYHQVRESGFDARFFVNGLGSHIRNLMVALNPPTATLIEASTEAVERYVKVAPTFNAKWYYKALELLQDCDLHFRDATDKQLLVEIALIRLCQLRAPQEQSAPKPGMAPLPQGIPAPQSGRTPQPQIQSQSKPLQSAVQPSALQPPHPAPVVRKPAPPVRRQPNAAARTASRSLHINNVSRQGVEEASDGGGEESVPVAGAKPADPELLQRAWESFIAANADKKLLLTAMRRGLPTHIQDATYQLQVDNQAQQMEAEMHIHTLAEHLRKATGNPAITLSVEVKVAEDRPRHLSDAEVLAEMVRKNPAAAQLLDLLDAEQI